jgi:hypothetical protein
MMRHIVRLAISQRGSEISWQINLPFVSFVFVGIYNFEFFDSTLDLYSGGTVANLKS